MNAITVSVDYADLLAVTLPRNRKHFDRFVVVTSPTDLASQRIARECGCSIYATDAFYRNGADFNKWLALEEGLDFLGRKGYLCVMDADVLWPSNMLCYWRKQSCPKHQAGFLLECPACNAKNSSFMIGAKELTKGNLYTPLRRMAPWPGPVPLESDWHKFPLHPQQREFAGYTQIFHADDPVLGPTPWYQTNWRHAGGADSFFQAKWDDAHKIRPPFTVLHLGDSGRNWMGRVTQLVDGTIPVGAMEKSQKLSTLLRQRGNGPDRFKKEKL